MTRLGLAAAAAWVASSALGVVGGKEEKGFDFVGNTFYRQGDGRLDLAGSCVAVGRNWVIGVTHANGHVVTIDGKSYDVAEQVRHPQADLVLMRTRQPLPTWAETDLVPAPGLIGRKIKIVGCGVGGSQGSKGFDTVEGSERVRRSATNWILGQEIKGMAMSGNRQLSSRCLTYRLDRGEGGQASRDSGGGWFVESDGRWKLAAVCAYVGPAPNGQKYGFGAQGYAVHLGAYASWIRDAMGD